MMGLETLEIVIGLVFVYLLFSTLVTLLVEYASSIFKLRAKNLRRIVSRALDDTNTREFSTEFYKHPLIKYLAKSDKRKPSYIGSDKFAKTVLDVIRTGGEINTLGSQSALDGKGTKISDAINGVGIIGPETKQLLVSFAKESKEDINEFGNRIEAWFNETVERGQGWFNRNIKIWTFAISIIVAFTINVDSIKIYEQLSENADLRIQLADGAADYLNEQYYNYAIDSLEVDSTQLANNYSEIQSDSTDYDRAKRKLESYYKEKLQKNTNLLDLGWDAWPWYSERVKNWGRAALGWLITAFAISLGAPFWFGLLNRLAALRGAGKVASKEEQAEKRITKQIT